MDVKPGDLVDKWTILRMKLRMQPGNAKILGLCIAHGTVAEQVLEIGDPNLLDLVEINAKIWMLESMIAKIRAMPMPDLRMAGEVAMEITQLNKLRQESIKRINEIGELNAEVKSPKEDLANGESKVE